MCHLVKFDPTYHRALLYISVPEHDERASSGKKLIYITRIDNYEFKTLFCLHLSKKPSPGLSFISDCTDSHYL